MNEALPANPLVLRPARPLPRRVAIVGAGTIGPDIAYYLASALEELELVLVDIRQEALDGAVARIGSNADKGVARRKLAPERAAAVKASLHPTLDYADLAGCDIVIEAATEDLRLKHRIFEQIEAAISPEALLTSNTSSLPAARLFDEVAHPERCTVTHFFAPAFRNPVVEVIDWPRLTRENLDYLRWMFAVTGKVPLVTDDVICFMLDRVFDNWCNQAALLLEHGTAPQVDSVALEFVHAGPFQVLNLANGNPIIVETNTLQMEEGEGYRPARIFESVSEWNTIAPGKPVEVEPRAAAHIRDRLLGTLFSQSFDILDRGVGTASDLELGCQLALGFKRGPLELMREYGDGEVRRIMDRMDSDGCALPGPKRPLDQYTTFWRHLLVDDLEDIKLVTLRRPQAMNALDDSVTDEILALFQQYDNDDSVAGFVLTGYGNRAFSAGADIGRFPQMLGDAEASTQYARDCSRLLVHIDGMRKPVVAALNGMALGGGLELALRCHGIVALDTAWMQLPEISLGIVPGIGGMVVPYRRWPAAAATFHGMSLHATRLKARQAAELGVFDALATDLPGLVERACARVRELQGLEPGTHVHGGVVELPERPAVESATEGSRRQSAEVQGIIAEAIEAAARAPSLTEALEIGYRAFGKSACTAAAREGIGAFVEGRRPDFEKTG